ncbi:MAG: hypothetical protein ACQKBU_04420, partial [Verrucomicrobiales bacterium]
MKRKTATQASLAAAVALTIAQSASAAVVYQDFFGDFDLTNNPDVGGGITAGTGSVTTRPLAEFAGTVGQGATTAGSQYGRGLTDNAFSVSGGFTLTVTFSISNMGTTGSPPWPSNSFSFGLVESSTALTDFSGFHSTFNGVGLNLTDRIGEDTTGLYVGDGTTTSVLSDGQTIT